MDVVLKKSMPAERGAYNAREVTVQVFDRFFLPGR